MSNFSREKSSQFVSGPGPLVAILMGTKNGARFLSEQLDSLAAQTHKNWFLIVSDDGSNDDTKIILRTYQAKWPVGKLVIREGPKQGFCANYLSMAFDPDIKAEYYAFCDQDDVWLPLKLERGVKSIGSNRVSHGPSLYCTCSIYVDESLRIIGRSRNYPFPPTFRNALVQSIAGGNTMLFNNALKTRLENYPIKNTVSHDWWLYLFTTGIGGRVIFDQEPSLYYRQHQNNVIGENLTIASKYERLKHVLSGRFKLWIDQNLDCLELCRICMQDDSIISLDQFKKMRKASFKDRLRLLMVSGIHRQSARGTLTLAIGLLLKKI